MRIGITGASGFLGRQIIKLAVRQGHEIVAYTRRPDKPVPDAHQTARFGPDGFLRDVSVAWETEAQRATLLGVSVCTVRVAMVLGNDGALPLMAPVFRLGLGGKLGTGRQWMSWVHVHDVAALFLHAATHEPGTGHVNGTAPNPVRNADFTKTFGAIVHRPVLFPTPAFVLRGLLGEGSRLVLDSQRALPARALGSGFQFRYLDLRSALRAALAPPRTD